MVLRSEQFNDVYFSAEDGLAETRHVFLDGNDLPQSWQGHDEFVICETGFGTGLNFLSAWCLFEKTAEPGQTLHFISVEKFPLSVDDMSKALIVWEELAPLAEALWAVYERFNEPGGGTISLNEKIRLDLHFGDVNEVMPALDTQVDCWFLDGFKPSTNPEMWSDTVFKNMARLSKQQASFATFTAAGAVRRGLQGAGFNVEKVPGFGRKREMLVGNYLGEQA